MRECDGWRLARLAAGLLGAGCCGERGGLPLWGPASALCLSGADGVARPVLVTEVMAVLNDAVVFSDVVEALRCGAGRVLLAVVAGVGLVVGERVRGHDALRGDDGGLGGP